MSGVPRKAQKPVKRMLPLCVLAVSAASRLERVPEPACGMRQPRRAGYYIRNYLGRPTARTRAVCAASAALRRGPEAASPSAIFLRCTPLGPRTILATWVHEHDRDCLDTCTLSWTLITRAQAPRGKSSTHGRVPLYRQQEQLPQQPSGLAPRSLILRTLPYRYMYNNNRGELCNASGALAVDLPGD